MSCNCEFTHLHVHSEYSTLDGMSKIEELVVNAKEMGQTSIALSDHGSTSGLWELQKMCDKHSMKPIMATEFYYERENDGKNGHLLVIAKNNKGLENLFKLQEFAYVHNFHYKPRINFDILKDHSEGLIVTSTCLGSAFNQMLIQGDTLGAIAWAKKFKEVFKDDFYIELQPNQVPEQYVTNVGSIRIAKQLGIKLVATNDVHYTYETDCFSHEVLLALQLNKKMSDEKRFKFTTQDFWLKSEEEMVTTFREANMSDDVVREAMLNTVEIANKCNARIEKGKFLPKFYDVPADTTERELLVQKVVEGAMARGVRGNKDYMSAVQEEINVIDRNGYSGYFLIVQDYVNAARESGIIVGDGRGSGAGSKVAYLSNITTIEPSQFDLVFERFMADGREPDFDVDFSDQDAVFEDLQKKYGQENVARIIAFGTLTPKAVTRKVLSAFGHTMGEISQVTKLIGEGTATMAEAFAESPELVSFAQKYKTEFDVISRLEGIVSHESQHAGGVIVYPNLSSILPIKSKADNKSKRIVAFDKYMLEELGHFKFDVLGLETLPIIRRTLDTIEEATGKVIDLDTIDYEDQRVYDMLCKGDVSGVFQINNQSGKVIEQQPRCFRDLIAINALIRPGVGDWNEYIARRRGKEWFVDPLRPWMHETLGIISYQEQYMLDAARLAGWAIADADKWLRKGKNVKDNVELRNKFITDGVANGHDEEYVVSVWDDIMESLGDYSFCKAHAASYGQTSFKTAFLKCYYPEYFYASMMTSEGDDRNAISAYVAECKSRGIQINPPSINTSNESFTVGNGGINYRITTIRDVGDSAILGINALRPIASFDDFLDRREKSSIKQNVLVNLIKAGTFDEFGESREYLMWKLDMSNRNKTAIKNDVQCPRYEWNDRIKAEWEKDALGMYLSVHPMEKYGFKPFDSYPNGEACLVGGEVSDFRTHIDKKGNEMAFATIDTLFGTIRITVFASTWSRKQTREDLVMGNLVLIKGKKDGDNVLLNTIEVLK